MAFYVSAIHPTRGRALLCGALRTVLSASRVARELFADADHFDTAYGTAQHRAGHPQTPATRAVAHALGLHADETGYLHHPTKGIQQ